MEPAPAGPRTIGRYEIRGVIGRGMMGVVYEAFDPALERTVALKSVQLTFTASALDQQEFDLRFLAEARAAAALSHPAVVVVHDVGRDPGTGRPFIAFERLTGRPLDEYVREEGPLPWRRALEVAATLARALHVGHRRGIIHRDIKPGNVMMLADGQPKIMDFGIAKLPALELTSTGQFMGTPSYVSPEQLATQPLDGRSDLFSLGAVLYFMLTGRVAFDGGSIPATLALISLRDPEPPSRLVPAVPSAVDDLVACALAKNPGDRPPDAMAFAEDLDEVAAGRPPRPARRRTDGAGGTLVASTAAVPLLPQTDLEPLPEQPPGPQPPSLPRRRRGVLLLGGAVLTAAVVGLGLLSRGGGSGPAAPFAPPARLEVDLEHSLKNGTMRVFVDEELRLEEPLESDVSEDLVLFKLRKGRQRATLEVRPGDREVRVQVTGDGWNASRRLTGAFESGQTRRLSVRTGGLLNKELRASWGS